MEIPHFVELMKRHGEKGLEIVGVAGRDGVDVRPFVEKNGLRYHVLLATATRRTVSAGSMRCPLRSGSTAAGIAPVHRYRSLESFEDIGALLETGSSRTRRRS
jgi:hypothetical protein